MYYFKKEEERKGIKKEKPKKGEEN